MNIRQITENNLHLYTDIRTLKEKEVELIDNDEDEIFNAMIDILNKKENSLSNKFKSYFSDEVSFLNILNLKLVHLFLEKNNYLIN